MNGPDHFREAERLARQALAVSDPPAALVLAMLSGAHATLALTAATAMQAAVDGSEPGMGSDEFHAWYRAAGVKPQPPTDDDPDEEVTTADVFTETELYEMDRDAEFAQDAAADERPED